MFSTSQTDSTQKITPLGDLQSPGIVDLSKYENMNLSEVGGTSTLRSQQENGFVSFVRASGRACARAIPVTLAKSQNDTFLVLLRTRWLEFGALVSLGFYKTVIFKVIASNIRNG